ncbi:hypothetical protein H4219_005920 [Mycoemilia scoparia]|uniref:Uncharacterized protein n=1 Tax=Mycoemilia scoparia TaxID=417184 RepID=A0A9W8DN90_9FUNG|nr:hypothetical protein H4219_005920 [Mycoemilia scoparia]
MASNPNGNNDRTQRFKELFGEMLTDDEEELLIDLSDDPQPGVVNEKINEPIPSYTEPPPPPSYKEAVKTDGGSLASPSSTRYDDNDGSDSDSDDSCSKKKKGKRKDRKGKGKAKERTFGEIKNKTPPPEDIPFYPSHSEDVGSEKSQETFKFGPEAVLAIQSSWQKFTTVLIDIDPDAKDQGQTTVKVMTTSGSGIFTSKPTIKTEGNLLKIRGKINSTAHIKVLLPRSLLDSHPGIEIKTDHSDARVYSTTPELLPKFKFNFKNGKVVLSDINAQYIIGDTTNVRLWAQNIKSEDGFEFSGAMRTVDLIRIQARRASISHKLGGLYIRDSDIGLVTCISNAGSLNFDRIRCHTLNCDNWTSTIYGQAVFESAINFRVDMCGARFKAKPKDPQQPFLIKIKAYDGSIVLEYDDVFRGLLRTSGFRFDTKTRFPHNDVEAHPPKKLNNGLFWKRYRYGDQANDQLIVLKSVRRNHGS